MNREKRVVGIPRDVFRWWPSSTGGGRLVWLARLVLGNDPVLFDIAYPLRLASRRFGQNDPR